MRAWSGGPADGRGVVIVVGHPRHPGLNRSGCPGDGARGFTLVELIVAIFVMTVLIGLLVPALSDVREHARRVVCASNQRQMGLALNMYADQNKDQLPPSSFLPVHNPDGEYRPQDMVMVRLDDVTRKAEHTNSTWDGIGFLYSQQYLPASSVFYCPSHRGSIRLEAYADRWMGATGDIVVNYHYRGMGPEGHTKLSQIPSGAAMVSDSLRSVEELNHEGGFNVLQAGLAVLWTPDDNGVIEDLLLRTDGGDGDADTARTAWQTLDGISPAQQGGAFAGR